MRSKIAGVIAACLLAVPGLIRAQTSSTQMSSGDATLVLKPGDMGTLSVLLKNKVVRDIDMPDGNKLLFLHGVREAELPLIQFDGFANQLRDLFKDQIQCRDCDDIGLGQTKVPGLHDGIYGPRWPNNAPSNTVILAPRKFFGEGVTIAFVDIGDIFSEHVEFMDGVGSRVTPAVAREHANEHATADAGTAAAAGVWPQARGAAPKARVIGVKNTDRAKFWTDVEAVIGKAAISSYSMVPVAGWRDEYWHGILGQPRDHAFGSYDADAFSADDLSAKNPAHLMVTTAGNDRSDGQLLSVQPIPHYHQVLENNKLHWEYGDGEEDKHPRDGADGGFHTVLGACVGKNTLCVGATFDSTAQTQTVVTDFSNFGPTLDGRIKPDLVANGAHVLALSTSAATLYKQRMNDGTSQATPLVAGVAALVIEVLKHYTTHLQPPAAMVKAVLLHTARAIDTGGPSPKSGLGLPDATAAAELLQNTNNAVKMVTVTAGAPTVVKFMRTSGEPFRVTAVWTDPPSSAMGGDKHALVNDVDTELTAAGIATPLLPWVLDDTKPFAARQAVNHKDNVEIIDVVDQGKVGVWTLTLRPNAFKPGTTQRVAIVVPGALVP